MEFRTVVDVAQAEWRIEPFERLLLVGSCFAQNMGLKFEDAQFPTVVNPFGVMYNPVSILHTVRRWEGTADVVVLTLGTNRVYVERATGEIVDNCEKRPQRLFEERSLSVAACTDALREACSVLRSQNDGVRIVLTVSPIRYRKYGYHGSQLSNATLLLAADEVVRAEGPGVMYFPAYELLNDELRDYRFYAPDMLHPSQQAVDYLWERFVEAYFSSRAQQWMKEWAPVRAALQHRPFHPDSPDYLAFRQQAELRRDALLRKWRK